MRRTDDRLMTCFINDDSICVNSCHVVKFRLDKPHSLSYKFILSLLNSKLYQKIFELQNPQMVGKTFAEIKVVYVEKLPLKEVNDTIQFPFISIVDEILSAKKEDPKADTSPLENEIDQLVYKLYNLTLEEIKIIEDK